MMRQARMGVSVLRLLVRLHEVAARLSEGVLELHETLSHRVCRFCAERRNPAHPDDVKECVALGAHENVAISRILSLFAKMLNH